MIFKEDGTIAYTLKRSKRAKHVRLKVTRTKGLEIVVPVAFKKAWLPAILEKRSNWIHNAVERLGLPKCGSDVPPLIPEKIILTAIGAEFDVQRVSDALISLKHVDAQKIIRTATGLLSIEFDGQILLPETASEDEHVELLQGWLMRCGREYLPEFLEEASEHVNIKYKKVQIRFQKSRWGSCSGRGTISLNARLLLLPFEQLRYILLHELAHVRHLNHSEDYWSFLATLDPRAQEYDTAMKEAWRHIPLCFAM